MPESRNGIIIEYTIDIFNQETGDEDHYTTMRNITLLTIDDLHPNYFYTYMISAATVVGRGPQSSTFSIRMPEDGKQKSNQFYLMI